DVRIVAATNKDLAAEVSKGEFREDLYYRLNVVEISLPPLRERPEDIPLLAEFFLQRLALKQGMARMRLTGEAIETLQQHHWPGNVRELENTIARACALCTTDLLLPEDIPFARSPFSLPQKISSALETLLLSTPESDESLLQHLVSEICRKVFDQSGNNLKETAQQLGITQAELREHLGN
ncbi:MAG TPA: sigma-54-dependent Fis family transcriptional regulator, partial [Verrucomicrobiales bacterium]|nr:sigma-54-dependent Fis family transcriptional regulator [Verrucomicrobiales bacterium]